MPTTRLAPSPTGALHLGNARTFLINWLLARQLGWRIVLRIEDLDGPRIKAGADRQILEDLEYLGLDWDESPTYQSQRMPTYQAAIDRLVRQGDVYPCICTRKEIDQAASAPHAEDGAAIYPGTCQGKFASIEEARQRAGREPALRFAVKPGTIRFIDEFAGLKQYGLACLGDFIIAKADGTPAYQLSVVVDDLASGVTHVVRGDDLLDSTPRQMLIYQALNAFDHVPRYCHLPLVVGEDGRRLAKRHGDTRISLYRSLGVPRARMLALLAKWCGMVNLPSEIDHPRDLLAGFDLQRVARQPIVFTAANDAFLRK